MSPTEIDVAAIPTEGLTLEVDFERNWLATALADTGAEVAGSHAHAHLEAYELAGQVDVRGRVTGTLSVPCSRCLTEAACEVDSPFRVTFLRKEEERHRKPRPEGAPPKKAAKASPNPKKEKPAPGPEVELTADDLDVAYYSGPSIELSDQLREQLLLAIPMTVLCQESCKGLCPTCGANRNVEACACAEPKADTRWDALKNLKLDH